MYELNVVYSNVIMALAITIWVLTALRYMVSVVLNGTTLFSLAFTIDYFIFFAERLRDFKFTSFIHESIPYDVL